MSRAARFVAPIALLATAVLLHVRQLAGGVLYWRDSHLLYVPAKQFLAESLRAGRLPEWWPWDGGGAPFLAQPMFSTFHPTSLLYLVFPFWNALALQDFAATLGALFGAYFLARRLGQARVSAVVAAISYGACGYLVSLTEHTFMKLSAGTMPWYAWALLVALAKGGRWRALPGLVLGSLLLAGDPQIAILATFFGTIVLVARAGPTREALLLAAVSPVVAAFVGAAQLVPSVLVVPETERQSVLSMANKWPLTARDLAGLVLPLDLGPYVFAASTFVGAAVLGLAAAGATRARQRPIVAALAMALVVAVWLSLGDSFGLNAFARKIVPFWARLRYPIKSLALANLALGLLAGEGMGQLANAVRRGRAIAIGAGVGVTALVVAAVGTGTFLASGAVGVLAFALPGRVRGWKTLAAALVAVPLVFETATVLRVTTPEFYDPPLVAKALHEAGVGLDGPAFDRVTTRVVPVEELPRLTVMGAGGSATCTNGLFRLPSVTAYMPGAAERIRRFFGRPVTPQAFARILGTWGVGFLVHDEPAGGTVVASDAEHGLTIERLSPSLPRAYGVRRGRRVAGPDEAFALMSGGTFKPGREVLLEADALPDEWSAREDQKAVPARVAARSAVSVDIDAELPWDGFVVLNEAYFRGWTATVDGSDRPVFPANGPMRAVEAPAGRHRISYRFRTPGLDAGLAISAAALVLGALFAVRRRASALPPPLREIGR